MGIKDFFKVTDANGNPIKDLGDKFEQKDLSRLGGLKVVIDAPPILHAAVRGMPNIETLMHNGKITSHLNSIFFNALMFKRLGIEQLWVFDGKPPKIKINELKKRKAARDKAQNDAKHAKKMNDIDKMKKLHKISYQLEDYIYEDTKKLLTRMGIPWAVAPEEAEAYCAYLNKKGEYDFVLSPDSDCFMFGANQLLRPVKENKKKVFYLYRRKEILKHLNIKQKQLIDVGLCLGTDFSDKVKGIGPKTVLNKVRNGSIQFTESQIIARTYFETAPTNKGAKVKRSQFNEGHLTKFLIKRGYAINRLAPHIKDLA